MKKRTISLILTAVNIVLVIAIVFLIIRIGTRQPLVESETALAAAEQEQMEEDAVSEGSDVSDNSAAEPESEKVLVAVPQTTSSVNVRSGPGTDFERIGSAYADCEYEVLECYDNGWTKLDYDGSDGYISTEYLAFRYRETTVDGGTAYRDVDVSALETVPAPDMEPEASEPEETEE